MFSLRQKREIADKVQEILRATGHPELPESEIKFSLHVDGAESWSWADIRNNGSVVVPGVNFHNEAQDTMKVLSAGDNERPPLSAQGLIAEPASEPAPAGSPAAGTISSTKPETNK